VAGGGFPLWVDPVQGDVLGERPKWQSGDIAQQRAAGGRVGEVGGVEQGVQPPEVDLYLLRVEPEPVPSWPVAQAFLLQDRGVRGVLECAA
jgi:hypothetical protein